MVQGRFSSPQRHSVATLSIRTCQCLIPRPVAAFDVGPGTAAFLGERCHPWPSPILLGLLRAYTHQRLHVERYLYPFGGARLLEKNWGIVFGKFPQFIFTRNEGPRVLRRGDTVILQSDSVDELLSLLPFYFPTITSTTPPWKINPSRPKYHLKETSITKVLSLISEKHKTELPIQNRRC